MNDERTRIVNVEAPGRCRKSPGRRGSALLYVTMTMVALIAFSSLGVDVGHVYVVKAELQAAGDAAARHGACGLSEGPESVRRRAADAADDNRSDGAVVVLDPTRDVELGMWDQNTKTFTALSGWSESAANAVRVTARRTKERGNPVSLTLAGIIGRGTFDVTVSVVAARGRLSAGLVGLDTIKINGKKDNDEDDDDDDDAPSMGSVMVDSYSSATGPYSAGAAGASAGLASNGKIRLRNGVIIRGDARPGPGRAVDLHGNAKVTGSMEPLAAPLVYPLVNAIAASSSNNNAQLPAAFLRGQDFRVGGGNNVTVPAGTYYLRDFMVDKDATLSFSGPATLYVNGVVTIRGAVNTSGNLPQNLKIRVVSSGKVTINGNDDDEDDDDDDASGQRLYVDLYAPQSRVKINDGGHGSVVREIFGAVVGKSLRVKGGGGGLRFHVDESLGNEIVGGGVVLVR